MVDWYRPTGLRVSERPKRALPRKGATLPKAIRLMPIRRPFVVATKPRRLEVPFEESRPSRPVPPGLFPRTSRKLVRQNRSPVVILLTFVVQGITFQRNIVRSHFWQKIMVRFILFVFTELVVLLGFTAPMPAQGFFRVQQDARSAALAGAVTAGVASPAALFYNPAGLAGIGGTRLLAGIALLRSDVAFSGSNPYPGYGSFEDSNPTLPIPFAYVAHRIARNWTVGLAVNAPFVVKTEWDDPLKASGRFISARSQFYTYVLSPGMAFALSEDVSLGVALNLSITDLTLDRVVPAIVNGRVFDAALMTLTGTSALAAGMSIGLRYSPVSTITLGLLYRSGVESSFTDKQVSFQQIFSGESGIDEAIRTQLPTGQLGSLDIHLPARVAAGLHLLLRSNLSLELDIAWNRWKDLAPVETAITDSRLNQSLNLRWQNTLSVATGLEYAWRPNWNWRIGYGYLPSPQPSADVGPFFVDSDAHQLSFGMGYRFGSLQIDGAALINLHQDRTADHRNPMGFVGKYQIATFGVAFSTEWTL